MNDLNKIQKFSKAELAFETDYSVRHDGLDILHRLPLFEWLEENIGEPGKSWSWKWDDEGETLTNSLPPIMKPLRGFDFYFIFYFNKIEDAILFKLRW